MRNAAQEKIREEHQPALKVISSSNLPPGRYESGWRAGKPEEDPEKTKRWGFITAKPSEYLVIIRDGRIDPRRSGRGARVFKWPWQSVAIVPTTLQQLEFVADQVTRERVGVTVVGIAVYRIVQPELAYQVLNFSYGERASEKLAATLGEMFVGAARRLIANLTLEECLTRRKEAIATFLMQEISPVVAGSGDPEGDSTDRGWGVVLDTIEIQNVFIQSKQVFEDLQAPFRNELATRSEMAELERQREVAERRAETERRTAEAAIQSERETRIMRARAESEAAEIEAAEAIRSEQARARASEAELARREALARKQLEVEEGIAVRQAESSALVDANRATLEKEKELASIRAMEEKRRAAAAAALADLKLEEERRKAQAASALADLKLEEEKRKAQAASALADLKLEEEKRRATAQAELAALQSEEQLGEESHRAAVRRLEQERERKALDQESELALQTQRALADRERRREEAEIRRVEATVDVDRQRGLAEVEQLVNQGRVLHEMVTTGLPQIANAFRQNFGAIHYTHVGGGAEGNPMTMVASAFGQLLTVAKGFGFDPARLMQAPDGSPAAPAGSPEDPTP